MLRRILLLFIFISATSFAFSQNIGINSDGSNADPSAILDVKASDRGLLIPRVAINNVNSASPVTSPAEGLLVYNETGSEAVGFYYWDGTKWVMLNTGSSSSGPWDRTAPNVYLVEDADSVGIGTNTPEAKLHINSRSANTSLLIEGNSLQSNTKPVILVQDNSGTEFFRISADSYNNLFMGLHAGENNDVTTPSLSEGESNTFLGSEAGWKNTIGYSNTAVGTYSLRKNTSGFNNNAMGSVCMEENTVGNYNNAYGYHALQYNTSGSKNIAIGSDALRTQSFSNGGTAWDSENIAVGYQALYNNQPTTTSNGYRNVAIGNFAMRANTTGYHNTAVGYQALYSNTTAIRNTAVGGFALANNTTGGQNTALGYLALAANTTGSENVAIGVDVLRNNISGSNNIGLGYRTLFQNSTGSYNIAIGINTLENNSTGGNNIAIGQNALFFNYGNDNVALGTNTLVSNYSSQQNIAIGGNALNSFGVFDNGGTVWNAHNIAIGYGSLAYLSANSTTNGIRNIGIGVSCLDAATTGYYNVAVGYGGMTDLTDAAGNTSVGYSSGGVITTGDYNTTVGYNVDPDASTRTNTVMIGGNDALALGGSNRARIGNASMTSIGGQVGWTTISDARLKSNVNEDVVGLNFIMKLRPVTYQYKIADYYKFYNEVDSTEEYPEKYDIEKIRFSGFLAQEVEAAANQSNYSFSGIDKPEESTGAYGLRYAEFVVPMVKAMQEQQQMIDELKKKISEQDEMIARMKYLEKEMEALKKEINAKK